jgi:hypothetical protein
VTITQAASPTTGSISATTYRVMEVDAVTQAGLPADTTGGLKPLRSLPKLTALIAQGR